MSIMTDEEILYNSYRRLGQRYESKVKKVDIAHDKCLAKGITSKSSLLLTQLTTSDILSPLTEIQTGVMKAKSMYLQYHSIKGRNPECITKSLQNNMDELIRMVCRHEADMISVIRQRDPNDEMFDLRSAFEVKERLNRLGNTLARDIVKDAINDSANPIKYLKIFYVTEKGRKYHLGDCRYCKGKHLTKITDDMVGRLELTPCKCVEEAGIHPIIDYNTVTAFIDESIRPVLWDCSGQEGKVGSYSYIVCWGWLKDESQISEQILIAEGVDYAAENEHVEKITEAAIAKVLYMMYYDYGFEGRIHIYTDNKPAAEQWGSTDKGIKLKKLYQNVLVDFVPREKNRKADKLGRTRIHLDLPMETYTELVSRVENKPIESLPAMSIIGKLHQAIRNVLGNVLHKRPVENV